MTEPRTVPPAQLVESERGFQQWIVEYATLRGWELYHPWLSVRSAAGWPDLVLCRPPRLVLAEVKGTTGRLQPAQRKWLGLLEACPGVEVFAWWPHHRDDISKVLL